MNSLEEPQRVPIRHRIYRHVRTRFARRPRIGRDWLGIAIILGAAFLVGNFVLKQSNLFLETSAIQNLISEQQFEIIKSAIERFK